jgi:hypothetical protein
MFEKDKAGSFFGARGEGCGDHSHHWFSSGFVKNGGDDNNFAGRYMHIDTDKNNFNSLNNIEDTRD